MSALTRIGEINHSRLSVFLPNQTKAGFTEWVIHSPTTLSEIRKLTMQANELMDRVSFGDNLFSAAQETQNIAMKLGRQQMALEILRAMKASDDSGASPAKTALVAAELCQKEAA